MSDNELTPEELEELIKNNKYLNRKPYDVSNILINGEVPEFDREVDRFMCAIDLGKFLNKSILSKGILDNIKKYSDSVNSEHFVTMLKQLSLDKLERITNHIDIWKKWEKKHELDQELKDMKRKLNR